MNRSLLAMAMCACASVPVPEGEPTPAEPSTTATTPTTPEAPDPAAEFCPWIADRTYADNSDAFFERTVVQRVDLDFADGDWQYQLDNPDLEEYRPVTVTWCGQVVEGAGMRFKKSTHPSADLEEGYPKSPMVIDLNEFVGAKNRLRGLRNLDFEYGSDQLLVAERLSYNLLEDFGIEAPRANAVEVWINGDYVGVFNNVERVDEAFTKYHFGNEGQLYKHAYCGTYTWQGAESTAYDTSCYQPKPGDSPTDFADLIGAISVIDDSSDADFEAQFGTVVNRASWMRTAAAQQAMAYTDSPAANGNNFYSYYPLYGPAEVIVWDLDLGFWIDVSPCASPYDTVNWDLFQLASCFDRLPLFERMVAVPAWRDEYLALVAEFADGPFQPDSYANRVDEAVALIREPLSRDVNRKGDDAAWDAEIAELVSLQAQRWASVDQQLRDNGVAR